MNYLRVVFSMVEHHSEHFKNTLAMAWFKSKKTIREDELVHFHLPSSSKCRLIMWEGVEVLKCCEWGWQINKAPLFQPCGVKHVTPLGRMFIYQSSNNLLSHPNKSPYALLAMEMCSYIEGKHACVWLGNSWRPSANFTSVVTTPLVLIWGCKCRSTHSPGHLPEYLKETI